MAGGDRRWLGWLWVVATVAALPIIIFALVVGGIHMADRQHDSDRERLHVARALASAVDAQLGAELEALRLLSTGPSLHRGDFAAFHARARAALETHLNWATIGLMTADGDSMVLSTTQPYPGTPPPPLDPDSIRKAAREGSAVIGALIAGGYHVSQPLVLLRAPVLRPDNTVTHVLSASVKTTAIADIIAHQNMSPDLRVSVVDHQGKIVVDTGARESSGQAKTETAPVSGWQVSVTGPSAWGDAEVRQSLGVVVGGGLLAVLLSLLGTRLVGRVFRDRIVQFEKMRAADLEAALREANQAQAAARSANDAKSRFLAAASHDLRQPFQAMMLYQQILDMTMTGPAKAREALDGLRNAIDAGDELLRALMDLSAIEAGTIKPQITVFGAMDIVEEIAAEYREIAQQRGLHFHVCRLSTPVESDRVLLKRIVRNLIHNAFRYTESGGILIGCRRRGNRLLIQIWDTGAGIPPDQIEMIFEDFYQIGNQARDRAKGLGLGLSVVRRMAALLCHELTVESRIGKGSVFTIAVPVAPEACDSDECGGECDVRGVLDVEPTNEATNP